MLSGNRRARLIAGVPVLLFRKHPLALVVSLGLAVRLILALLHEGYLGIDGGAYLLSVQQVLGQDPVGQDFTRPPLAPGWLLVPFAETLGYDIGYKVWAAIFSTAPTPVMFLLLRRLFPINTALVATLIFTFDVALVELFVTGPLPLIGFALIGLALWAVPAVLTSKPTPWAAIIVLAITGPLTASVNMTSAGIYLIAVPTYGVAASVMRSKNLLQGIQGLKYVAIAGLAGGVMSLGLLPWYMDVLPGSGNLNHPGDKLFWATQGNWGWYLLISSVGWATYAFARIHDWRTRAFAIPVLIFGLLGVVWSQDEAILNVTFRGRYLAIMLSYPICAHAFRSLLDWFTVSPRYRAQLAGGLSVLMIVAFFYGFDRQTYFSDQVNADTGRLLEAIREVDPGVPIVVSNMSMQWWVSALNRVEAPAVWNQEPPPLWQSDHEQVACVLGWQPCDVGQAVKGLGGPHFVLADTSFPERNQTVINIAPPDPWKVTSEAPWLNLVYSKGDVRLWRIDLADE